MGAESGDHERTMAFADIALGQIKALRQSAEPRNYEVWYHYATGYNPSLNKAINDMLAQKGSLSDADLHALHHTHISSTRLTQELDTFGAKVADEIEQVMAMMDAAVGSATSYTESLADASHQLRHTRDREELRAIVECVVGTTKEIERSNHALEARLKASRQEISELQKNLEAIRHESLTDPLTSLANRKYFDQALADVAAKNEAMSLIMIDIDHFKSFNDTYGHLTGDQVLRLVGLSVKQNVKDQDIAARYGGEEFAVILPGTALRQAVRIADHIRRTVMGKELMKRSTGETLGRVTVSIGVASWNRGDTAQSLIERADSCLYAAKRAGRNRVACEADPEVISQSKVA